MSTLRIQHVGNGDVPRLSVVRARDGKTTEPVTVVPPVGFPVEGQAGSGNFVAVPAAPQWRV